MTFAWISSTPKDVLVYTRVLLSALRSIPCLFVTKLGHFVVQWAFPLSKRASSPTGFTSGCAALSLPALDISSAKSGR